LKERTERHRPFGADGVGGTADLALKRQASHISPFQGEEELGRPGPDLAHPPPQPNGAR
jgi:hypothetical protein